MKKIRVCHFTSVHPSNDRRIFEKECTALAQAGYEVYWVVPNANEELIHGVAIVNVPITSQNRFSRFLNTARRVYEKALSLEAEIYHFHDPELLPYGLKLKRKGKKVIFDSHEFYGLQIKEKKYLPSCLRSFIASLYMKYEAYVCRKLDAVVQVCTVAQKNYFKNRAAKTIFLANYPSLDDLLLEVNNAPKEDAVIHIGGLTHERGITHLVETAQIITTSMRLAGPFSSQQYQDALMQMEGFKNVQYLGFLPKQLVNNELKKCIAGISTLLNVGQYYKIDTLPTKVYEYMALALPVILSDSPYNQQLNKIYNIGICVAADQPQQIAKAIQYLKDNPQEAQEMGMNGKKLVQEQFNWEIEKEKLLHLYHTLQTQQ